MRNIQNHSPRVKTFVPFPFAPEPPSQPPPEVLLAMLTAADALLVGLGVEKCPSYPILLLEKGSSDTFKWGSWNPAWDDPANLSDFYDFHRRSEEHEDCTVAIAMAIPGARHRIPQIYYARVTCGCWACSFCGPALRKAWYASLLAHFREAVDAGETIYFSWLEGLWDTTYKAIGRATQRKYGPGAPNKYVGMRHEDGGKMLLTTADIGGEPIPPGLLPQFLAKCIEYTDLGVLGKRPISPSDTWGLPPKVEEKHPTGMVFLGIGRGNFEEKIREICQRTGASARRWGDTDNAPRIIEGFDEAWQTWGNWRALVQDVLGIRGSPFPGPDDPHEQRLLRLWEGAWLDG